MKKSQQLLISFKKISERLKPSWTPCLNLIEMHSDLVGVRGEKDALCTWAEASPSLHLRTGIHHRLCGKLSPAAHLPSLPPRQASTGPPEVQPARSLPRQHTYNPPPEKKLLLSPDVPLSHAGTAAARGVPRRLGWKGRGGASAAASPCNLDWLPR